MLYALVTGASKGIGKEIALALAAKGFSLVLVARSEDGLSRVKTEVEAAHNVSVEYLALDLSAPDAAVRLLQWTQEKGLPVAVLVNNAGYGLSGAFEAYPLDQHLNMLQLNCTTLVQLCHLFLPVLKRQPKSYILNIASTAAYQAVPYLTLYAASKSFVVRFSRGLRHELRKSGVGVTCVSPGTTTTDFNARAQVGPKALKAAAKVTMPPDVVARKAVESLLAGKGEVVVGGLNKVGAFMAWLLPKKLVETTTAKIYE